MKTNWKSTKPLSPLTVPDVSELKKAVEEMYVPTIVEFEVSPASLMKLFEDGAN